MLFGESTFVQKAYGQVQVDQHILQMQGLWCILLDQGQNGVTEGMLIRYNSSE